MKRDEWLALTDAERREYANPNLRCLERGCDEPAGTPWGPYWCARHDTERLHRIAGSLAGMGRLGVVSVDAQPLCDSCTAHRVERHVDDGRWHDACWACRDRRVNGGVGVCPDCKAQP